MNLVSLRTEPDDPTLIVFDAVDPTETWASQDFRSAKITFVLPLKRDIVPSIAWTRPPREGHMAVYIQRRSVLDERGIPAARGGKWSAVQGIAAAEGGCQSRRASR